MVLDFFDLAGYRSFGGKTGGSRGEQFPSCLISSLEKKTTQIVRV